jgi:hypothetical protein
MAPSKMLLKLLVDNKAKKVLFAEAGKEFVDFVFSLLTLPIGGVAKLDLVSSAAGIIHGSVDRIYRSVYRMGAPYLQPGTNKSDLLQPMVPRPDGRDLLLQLLSRFKLYTCPGRCVTMTMDDGADCPHCKQPMAEEMAYVLPSATPKDGGTAGPSVASDERLGGYVKGLVTDMVTDGLEVTPMRDSISSSITIINKYSSGKDVELAEEDVAVGMDEVRVRSCIGLPATVPLHGGCN